MAESSDFRTVSREDGDTRYIVTVPRTPETDAMTDDELINRLIEVHQRHTPQQDG